MAASLKGLVLAAGFGSRLRPLTEVYPKPLMPVLGTHPLELALWRLQRAGATAFAANTHHRAKFIEAYASENPLKVELHLSYEGEILGTGGAYNPLRSWLGSDDLVVINGDVVTDLDVKALVTRHREAKAIATMALLPNVIPGESGVWHKGGLIVGIGKAAPGAAAGADLRAGNFACVQVLSRAFIDLLPRSGSFDVISKGYDLALARKLPIACHIHNGVWHDLRTPSFYWEALKDLATRAGAMASTGIDACRLIRGLGTVREGGTLRDASTRIGANATFSGTVIIEPHVRIGSGVCIEDSLLLPYAEVPNGSVIKGTIFGGTLAVPIHT